MKKLQKVKNKSWDKAEIFYLLNKPVFVSEADSPCAFTFPRMLFFRGLLPFWNNVTDLEEKQYKTDLASLPTWKHLWIEFVNLF